MTQRLGLLPDIKFILKKKTINVLDPTEQTPNFLEIFSLSLVKYSGQRLITNSTEKNMKIYKSDNKKKAFKTKR